MAQQIMAISPTNRWNLSRQHLHLYSTHQAARDLLVAAHVVVAPQSKSTPYLPLRSYPPRAFHTEQQDKHLPTHTPSYE